MERGQWYSSGSYHLFDFVQLLGPHSAIVPRDGDCPTWPWNQYGPTDLCVLDTAYWKDVSFINRKSVNTRVLTSTRGSYIRSAGEACSQALCQCKSLCKVTSNSLSHGRYQGGRVEAEEDPPSGPEASLQAQSHQKRRNVFRCGKITSKSCRSHSASA